MVLFCLFTAFIKYTARGIQRFSMYVEDLLPSGCCLLAHGWLSTVAWNLPDFLGSANLIFSVSQPHSPLIYAVCSLWFPCLCPSTRWSSSQKDENKARNLFHPAPVSLWELFPSSSASSSLQPSATIWPLSSHHIGPPWQTPPLLELVVF